MHARVVAPHDVAIFTYPDLPHYDAASGTSTSDSAPSFDADGTLLLYPVPDAPSLQELAASGELSTAKRLVVVDSTWEQAAKMLRHKGIQSLRKVRIGAYRTLFWRYQTGKTDDHLATIEAIYFFYRVRGSLTVACVANHPAPLTAPVQEYHMTLHGSYQGQYDNLLFYFILQYKLVQVCCGQRPSPDRCCVLISCCARVAPGAVQAKRAQFHEEDAHWLHSVW